MVLCHSSLLQLQVFQFKCHLIRMLSHYLYLWIYYFVYFLFRLVGKQSFPLEFQAHLEWNLEGIWERRQRTSAGRQAQLWWEGPHLEPPMATFNFLQEWWVLTYRSYSHWNKCGGLWVVRCVTAVSRCLCKRTQDAMLKCFVQGLPGGPVVKTWLPTWWVQVWALVSTCLTTKAKT